MITYLHIHRFGKKILFWCGWSKCDKPQHMHKNPIIAMYHNYKHEMGVSNYLTWYHNPKLDD